MSDEARKGATLMVSVDDHRGMRLSAATDIAGPFYEAFDPVDVCSRPEVAMLMRMGGSNAHTEETVRVVRKRREHYAAILAKAITEQIVKQMGARDTRDGYKR